MMPQIEASINRGKPDMANSPDDLVGGIQCASLNSVCTNTRRPARSTMTLRRRAKRAGLAMPALRDCSLSTEIDSMTAIWTQIEFAPQPAAPLPVRLI